MTATETPLPSWTPPRTHAPVLREAGSRTRRAEVRRRRITFHVSRLTSHPIDLSSLAAFRILFGVLMAAAMVRFVAKGWVQQMYIQPVFYFSYPGFEWVRPWPGAFMYVHFIVLAALALGIALGFYYRICIALFFVGFTYVELLDQTAYLNHYYLISLLSGLLMPTPAHRLWSVDAWRRPQIRSEIAPAWCLNLLRFQIVLVYLFAGLAKFNADWLFHAQPLRIWLAARSDVAGVGPWLAQPWVAYAASWFGAFFDTSIAFLLLYQRTRWPAYAVLVFFHVATWVLFNIGMFPWIMIAAATLLFPPDWPRHWLRQMRMPGGWWRATAQNSFRNKAALCVGTLRPGLRLFLAAYVAVQLFLAVRPWFYSQPPAWTCSGFNCAWRVMLAEKSGYAEFYATQPGTGQSSKVPLNDYLTPRQEMMMAQDPYLIRQLARRLSADLSRKGNQPVRITVNAFATLNGRPSQRLIDPNVNLAAPASPGWILPLARSRSMPN